MNPVLQQVLPLLGVLLGAMASFTATTLTERSRWKRAHATRWDDKRLAAYTDYANSIKTAAYLCYRLTAARGFPSGGIPIDQKTGLSELSDAERDRQARWETVLLLGSPEVAAAARTWHECLWKLEWLARGHQASEEEFREMMEGYFRARNDFYTHARADLGVTSGDLPAPGPRDSMRWQPLPNESDHLATGDPT